MNTELIFFVSQHKISCFQTRRLNRYTTDNRHFTLTMSTLLIIIYQSKPVSEGNDCTENFSHQNMNSAKREGLTFSSRPVVQAAALVGRGIFYSPLSLLLCPSFFILSSVPPLSPVATSDSVEHLIGFLVVNDRFLVVNAI